MVEDAVYQWGEFDPLSPGKEKVMSTFKTATKSHGDLNTKCNALDKAIQNVLKSILKYVT